MNDCTCPKCSCAMQLGFQADGVHQGTLFRQACWAAGPPEVKDWKFLGLNLLQEWVLNLSEKDLHPIVTMRCSSCGFLEHYAPPREQKGA